MMQLTTYLFIFTILLSRLVFAADVAESKSMQHQKQCQTLVSTFTETVNCSQIPIKLKYAIDQRKLKDGTFCERVFSFTSADEINETAHEEYQIQQCLKMEMTEKDKTVFLIMDIIKMMMGIVLVALLGIISILALKKFLK